ncbi:MAG: DoxX family protein [Melioribacteraceae bacterium]|nr:DoxX family protein [Melioribacteraceae bacterium]
MNIFKTKTDINFPIIIIRIMVGFVFISEGIQKFLYPEIRGVGRFIKIGIPYPEFFGYFVPTFEIVCGVLILIGLFTRLASIPLIIIMLTAIISSKIPILINEGFWEMAHAARTDWSMLLGSIFLLIVGAGKYSIDNYLSKKSGVLP